MVRPESRGLDYFPFDTDAREDKRIKALLYKHGNNGWVFYTFKLMDIYKEDCFIEAPTQEMIEIEAMEMRITAEEYQDILQTCLKLGLFDRNKFSTGFLTSKSIQNRYKKATERRNNNEIPEIVNVSINPVNVYNNPVNVDDNPVDANSSGVNVDDNPQSKVNKSKVNKEKEKEKEKEISFPQSENSSLSKSKFIAPTSQEVQTYVDAQGFTVNALAFCDFYESKGWMIGKNKMKSWQNAVRTWQSREGPKPKSQDEEIEKVAERFSS